MMMNLNKTYLPYKYMKYPHDKHICGLQHCIQGLEKGHGSNSMQDDKIIFCFFYSLVSILSVHDFKGIQFISILDITRYYRVLDPNMMETSLVTHLDKVRMWL